MEVNNRKYAWQENQNSSFTQGSNYMQTGAYASGTNERGGAYRRQENVQIENNSNPTPEDNGLAFSKVSALINALEELKPHLDDIKDCLRKPEQTKPSERHAHGEEILNARKQNESLKREISDLQGKYDKQLAENEQRYNKLYQENEIEVGKVEVLTENNDKLQRAHKALKDENALLKNECSQTKAQVSKLQDEHGKLKTELSDCKTRLSRLMGGKLSNNNPDIADLSDSNRPTKLGEMYQELYDNEWTEAYEQCTVEFNQDENKSIQTLLDLLQETKSFCDRKAEEQTTKLKEAVAMAYDGARTTETTEIISRQIKDLRKQAAEISFQKVYQDFNVYCKNRLIMKEKVQPFVKKCTKLCWLMTVQDPPVVFGHQPKRGESFDTNVYKHYTITGPHIEFCVWPTMLLHKDGPLLSKGVAQGRKQQFSQTVYSTTRCQKNDTASALSASLRNVSTETYTVTRPLNEQFSGMSTPKGHENWQQSQGSTQNAAQSYQQSVVNTSVSSSQLEEKSSRSSNETAEQGTGARKASPKLNELPTQMEWNTFNILAKLYGFNSDELKVKMKDRYDVCMNYYLYEHGSSV